MTNSSTLRSCRASAFLGRVRTDIFLYTETMLNKDENRIFTKVLQMPNYQGQAAMEDLTAAPAKETEKQCGIRYIYLQSENSFFLKMRTVSTTFARSQLIDHGFFGNCAAKKSKTVQSTTAVRVMKTNNMMKTNSFGEEEKITFFSNYTYTYTYTYAYTYRCCLYGCCLVFVCCWVKFCKSNCVREGSNNKKYRTLKLIF